VAFFAYFFIALFSVALALFLETRGGPGSEAGKTFQKREEIPHLRAGRHEGDRVGCAGI